MSRRPAPGDGWLADSTRAPRDSPSPCDPGRGWEQRARASLAGGTVVWPRWPLAWEAQAHLRQAHHRKWRQESGCEGRLGEGVSNWPQHPAELDPVWGPELLAAVGRCRLTVARVPVSSSSPSMWSSEFNSPRPAELQAAPPRTPPPDRTGQVRVGALPPGSFLPRCPGHLSACPSHLRTSARDSPWGAHCGVCCTNLRGRTLAHVLPPRRHCGAGTCSSGPAPLHRTRGTRAPFCPAGG